MRHSEATGVNAPGPPEFRIAAREPIAFMAVSAFGNKELIMVERRKSARLRKTPIRNSARNNPRKTTARKASPKHWSQRVTQGSDALDLKHGVFTLRDPKRIAASLKRSAERSSRRKAGAYRSALSMLTFYINRAGKTLPKTQRERLERAKGELKRVFHRE
jgi:hypothetical protein